MSASPASASLSSPPIYGLPLSPRPEHAAVLKRLPGAPTPSTPSVSSFTPSQPPKLILSFDSKVPLINFEPPQIPLSPISPTNNLSTPTRRSYRLLQRKLSAGLPVSPKIGSEGIRRTWFNPFNIDKKHIVSLEPTIEDDMPELNSSRDASPNVGLGLTETVRKGSTSTVHHQTGETAPSTFSKIRKALSPRTSLSPKDYPTSPSEKADEDNQATFTSTGGTQSKQPAYLHGLGIDTVYSELQPTSKKRNKKQKRSYDTELVVEHWTDATW